MKWRNSEMAKQQNSETVDKRQTTMSVSGFMISLICKSSNNRLSSVYLMGRMTMSSFFP